MREEGERGQREVCVGADRQREGRVDLQGIEARSRLDDVAQDTKFHLSRAPPPASIPPPPSPPLPITQLALRLPPWLVTLPSLLHACYIDSTCTLTRQPTKLAQNAS
jgi:hypothetical protein